MRKTLDTWRRERNLTYAALGRLIGATKVQARRYCLSDQIPNPDMMRCIWRATGGEVDANSFYLVGVADAAA